eukprot:gene9565-biopygen15205
MFIFDGNCAFDQFPTSHIESEHLLKLEKKGGAGAARALCRTMVTAAILSHALGKPHGDMLAARSHHVLQKRLE